MWVSNSDQTSAEAQALGAIFGFICERCDNYVDADMGEYCGDAWLCFMCQETIAVFSENSACQASHNE